MTATTVIESSTGFDGLRKSADLELFTPGDEGYDTYRTTWNTAVEHRPLAVAVPDSAAGVVDVVNYARESGMSVAIQSSGHGPTRPARDAILVNMCHMTEVSLDPVSRRVRMGGGAKWQAVLDVVTPHGLAPLLGSTPDVSAVGYTLGGGLGWLARKYGTSADSVVAFEVVTADGRVLRAAADENPELFWALRGAGAGHLGVIVSMEVQLYPIAQVYGGNMFYPAEMAVEVIRRWRDWLPTVPESLTSAVSLINFPAEEGMPAEISGKPFILVRGAFDGPTEEGERLLSYWRDWRRPELDMFGPLPFDRIAEVSDDPLEPIPNEGTGLWLRSLSDRSIADLAAAVFTGEPEPLLVMAEMRHIGGGAVARGSAVPAAFGNRDALILLELVGVTPTRDLVSKVREVIAGVRRKIAPDLTGGRYLNYTEGDERRYGVRQGVAAGAYERLAALKSRLDPGNLFDHGLDVTS